MKTLKWVYKLVRSLLFTAIILVVVIFVAAYVALSIPPVQNYIRERVQTELSGFLGSKVEIRNLTIRPLNEVIIEGAEFYDRNQRECLNVERLGAGINIWRLIFSNEIEITYVELIDFKANIYQLQKDGPLNIDYIIKAFEPKEKNKPPTQFDLKIHNIVLRGGEASFSREWMPLKKAGVFDADHISVTGLNADVTIPKLSNKDIQIDLRHLSINEKSGLQIKELKGYFKITPQNIAVNKFELRLPQTDISIPNLVLPQSYLKNFKNTNQKLEINLQNLRVTPSDLAVFYEPLQTLDTPWFINLSVSGNMNSIAVENLDIKNGQTRLITLKGYAGKLTLGKEREIDIDNLKLDLDSENLRTVMSLIPSGLITPNVEGIINQIEFIDLDLKSSYSAKTNEITLDTKIDSNVAHLGIDGLAVIDKEAIDAILDVDIPSVNVSDIMADFPVTYLADSRVKLSGKIDMSNPQQSTGVVDLKVGEIEMFDRLFTDIACNATLRDDYYAANVAVDDANLKGKIEASLDLTGKEAKWDLEAQIQDFDTYSSLLTQDESKGFEFSGNISAHGIGNSQDNISGSIVVSDLNMAKINGRTFTIDNFSLQFENHKEGPNSLYLESDIADFSIAGNYDIVLLPGMIRRTMGEILPSVFNAYDGEADCGNADFELVVKNIEPVTEFFNIPVIPLTTLTLKGGFNSENDFIDFSSNIPYIQQGANTLITDTYIEATIIGKEGKSKFSAGTVYPTKKGLLKIDLGLNGDNGEYAISLDLNKGRDVSFFGNISIDLFLEKDPLNGEMEIIADWLLSHLYLNDTEWTIEEAKMIYDRDGIRINNFSIRHDDQFVVINGYSTKSGEGEIMLDLADINVDYIFETLNIPHVTFGGNATGKAFARSLFSPNPEIYTEDFVIKDMSYNGAVVGDGEISGRFDLPQLKVGIGAKIHNADRLVADVDGGVWIGRDSLAFKFDADRVNAGVVKPFMKAFSSDIKGTASGQALLYGTFSDIDMTGTLVANDVEVLVDYINARYFANDTVYMSPGKIELPSFEVKDKFGRTAVLNGVVNHRYFHDPTFSFTISDMDNLLVYDTNARINPRWYGTIFASGAGEISGRPGIVSIKADVETGKGSDFTFVLSDQLEAIKSNFLTFSDRRKEAQEAAALAAQPKDTVPEFLKRFQKNQQKTESVSTEDVITMDIRASVTDDVRFNLIMDPAAGDKITAYGNGAMTMSYSSLTDELKLYGKYILEKGTYNFSLQDIILKEFIIKPGSSIAFTGDPYTGVLDITAAYKVNTSLTELDSSFANDRELNRTSVPVEALLNVTGVLTSPSIAFDIDLPTVTEETAQKVRSIISTDDMMSRQVLYLVALNKFYPPEYMTTSNSGGEWASIATSTISSQIQNMIGQLTDKFSVAPSIKSDKGDFSDIEFDLGLSSQLFNNRLLINGNLGYRDPSNSSTTFIGDFDLEYLLTNKGNWRLKAYNHFNDQNYYLKSSLTTQGIGIIWRKDFGLPRSKEEKKDTTVKK